MKNNKDDFEFSPRIRKKDNENKEKLKKLFLISAVVLVALSFSSLALGYSMINSHTVAEGVFIQDMDLSDLSLSQTEQALEDFTLDDPYKIVIEYENNVYLLDTSELEYSIDTNLTAKKAFQYGKNGSLFSKIIKAIKAKTKKIELLPAFIFDDTQIAEKLNEFGIEALGEVRQHEVTVENDKIIIKPGTKGYNGDPTDALSGFNYALENETENLIKVTFNTVIPDLLTVDRLSQIVSADGLDAAFSIENGEVIITEGRSGYIFDEAEATEALAGVYEGGKIVTINCSPVAPKISYEELKAKLFNTELASYSTRYNQGQVSRSKNVAVAASKLDGVIILPGEILSFNDIVGKRTTENGFKPAPEYQNGKSVTGIGGGTCQVSTTLYSAALYANLEIVSRRNHSMSVSYVPLGQDATVTDSGTDLKIKNNTSYPIKLKTSAGGGKVSVKIIGTAYEPSISVKIINTQTSPLSATTTRVVYDETGAEISRELIANSKYKPHEEETTTSTQKPSETPTPEATEVAGEEPADKPTESKPPQENTPQPPISTPLISEEPKKTQSPETDTNPSDTPPMKALDPVSEKTE